MAQGSHQHLSATGLVSQPGNRGESPRAFIEIPVHWSNHPFSFLQPVLSNTNLSFQLCHSYGERKHCKILKKHKKDPSSFCLPSEMEKLFLSLANPWSSGNEISSVWAELTGNTEYYLQRKDKGKVGKRTGRESYLSDLFFARNRTERIPYIHPIS